jgi:glutamate racemase
MKSARYRVGVFDSGIGGFSILRELFKSGLDADYYYFADQAYTPYGEREDSEIFERSCYIIDQLLKEQVELVVVACNTATAAAIDLLRRRYPKIPLVGVEPYINIRNQPDWNPNERACVITTPLTGSSARFAALKSRLDPKGEVDHYSCPNLARLVEERFDNPKMDLLTPLQQELAPLMNKGYHGVILGCTHYPLICQEIEQVTGMVTISPCEGVAARVVQLLSPDATKVHDDDSKSSAFYFRTSLNSDLDWQERPAP